MTYEQTQALFTLAEARQINQMNLCHEYGHSWNEIKAGGRTVRMECSEGCGTRAIVTEPDMPQGTVR